MINEDYTMYPKEELIDIIHRLEQENAYLKSELDEYVGVDDNE